MTADMSNSAFICYVLNVSALVGLRGYLLGIHSELVLNYDPLVLWREMIDGDGLV